MRKTKIQTSGALRHWDVIGDLATRSFPRANLFVGDAYETLSQLPSGSVNTCLTSPPYWGARDYEMSGQIGQEKDVERYVEKIIAVFHEIKRVLRPDGTAWLNLGDRYLHGVGTENGRPPSKGWKRNKQLSMVPFRVALSLQEEGWWVRNILAWSKPNAMPISTHDRLVNAWEPVFLLARDEKYYFNLDAVRVPHKTDDFVERVRAERGKVNGKAKGKKALRRWLNSPRHRATIEGVKEISRRPNAPDPVELAAYLRHVAKTKGLAIEEIANTLHQPFERVRHYFRTDRIGSRLPPKKTWEKLKLLLDLDDSFDAAMAVEYGDNIFRNHPNGRNPGDVKEFSVANTPGQHFATMPFGLAEWCLKATLPVDGICLDPFMGHGTTGKAALSLGGRFVGIDLHREYVDEFVGSLKGDRKPSEQAAPKKVQSIAR